MMIKFIDHIKRFVHFHYKLSERTDTPYWREVANKPNAIKDLCDYIDIIQNDMWVDKGETRFNQWNWTSMLLGFEKQYLNQLPEIEDYKIEQYLHYTDMLIKNYEFIVGKNIPIKDWLDIVHGPI